MTLTILYKCIFSQTRVFQYFSLIYVSCHADVEGCEEKCLGMRHEGMNSEMNSLSF